MSASFFVPAEPSSLLAFMTTVHLAAAALRNHRIGRRGSLSPLVVIAASLSATPWLFPSLAGLALGLTAQVAWFVACERFASPVPVVSDARRADAGGPARPRGFVQTSVLAVTDEAQDVKCFRLARPEGFAFVPGQFLAVRVRFDGRDFVRCYSISSAPHAEGYLEIGVKRQGRISSVLHATLRPGSRISVKAPAGTFTYPADEDRPLLLLAGGIGITPLFGILRHAVATEPRRPVTLLYSAQTEDGLAFRAQLRAIADRHPDVRVVFAVTRGTASPDIYPGRIDESLVHATCPDVREAIALICGPVPMIDGMRALLSGIGLPDSRIRFEVFEQAIAAVGSGSARGHRAGTASHEARCARSGMALRVEPDQTLLEAAEAGGVEIDSICRAGICGTCRTRVIAGEADCESTTLDAADQRDGYVLACVTRLRSDCVVEL